MTAMVGCVPASVQLEPLTEDLKLAGTHRPRKLGQISIVHGQLLFSAIWGGILRFRRLQGIHRAIVLLDKPLP